MPYDPEMMVRIILYGYAIGVTSSRKLEKRTIEDIAFRYLAGGNTPDHHTINEFRRIHRAGLSTSSTRSWKRLGRRAWPKWAGSPSTAPR